MLTSVRIKRAATAKTEISPSVSNVWKSTRLAVTTFKPHRSQRRRAVLGRDADAGEEELVDGLSRFRTRRHDDGDKDGKPEERREHGVRDGPRAAPNLAVIVGCEGELAYQRKRLQERLSGLSIRGD
jgi:hypothetical protein